MKNLFLLINILFLFLFSSCEKDLEFGPPVIKPKYYIDVLVENCDVDLTLKNVTTYNTKINTDIKNMRIVGNENDSLILICKNNNFNTNLKEFSKVIIMLRTDYSINSTYVEYKRIVTHDSRFTYKYKIKPL
jgi:hypothetical protein